MDFFFFDLKYFMQYYFDIFRYYHYVNLFHYLHHFNLKTTINFDVLNTFFYGLGFIYFGK